MKGIRKVTKTGLVLLALFAGATTAAAQSADPIVGEDAFVTDCVQCHASAARIVRKIRGGTAEEKSTWLDVFLEDHYVSDIEKKADLIAYLVDL